MQKELNTVDADENEDSSLLDCYRIAIDFGMPAALKAYEKLAIESTQISEETIAIDN